MAELSRKERETERKRNEILLAAMSVFAQKGFRGATMAEISQASEYPLGSIYKFFSGKEIIYHDLVMEKGVALRELLLPVLNHREWSPKQRLHECMRANARFFKDNREFIRIYIAERNNIDAVLVPNLNRNINRMHDKLLSLYGGLFQEGIDTGDFKPHPSQDMAMLFSGMLHATAWYCLAQEDDDDQLERRFETAFTIFSDGIDP